MRTTLSIDEALLKRAKQRASAQGLTLGGFVEEALRDYLSAPHHSAAPVDLPVFPGGRPRSGVDPSSNRSLYDMLDEVTRGRS
ncbi:type II toxin-antitoxin system VapB family antitoxin [Brooklawnia cerclae]|uniref:Ribbon-helix-helix protein CopG domain-containing protein n=1 Tax=Brooklawnia cerclae TaxID=349934 RepID=A0ABX0SG17_9ACTN|nr:type II toxin-antitoxin system VapB family antitoxin [Brooklawnia cerclae]NIH56926.1 hypothetical protein [Brooklawnia cerclae]